MDPVTLIVLALAAGAASGLKDVASSTVTDAYSSLKALIKKKLTGHADGELALARYEGAPQTWEAVLRAELITAGAATDGDVIAAAQELMRLVDEAGYRSGKYAVDLRGSQGVQVGDHNTQHNTFGVPPAR